jgi:hypothetical protein
MKELKMTGSVPREERVEIAERIIMGADMPPLYKEAIIHHMRTAIQQAMFEGARQAKQRYAVDEVTRAKLEAVIEGFKLGATYQETSTIINTELQAIEHAQKGA